MPDEVTADRNSVLVRGVALVKSRAMAILPLSDPDRWVAEQNSKKYFLYRMS